MRLKPTLLFSVVVVLGLLAVGARRWKQIAQQTACLANLKHLVDAMESGDRLPSGPSMSSAQIIESLVASKRITSDQAHCPTTGESYVVMIPNETAAVQAGTRIVAHEPLTDAHGHGANTFFLDGHGEFLTPIQYGELVESLNLRRQ